MAFLILKRRRSWNGVACFVNRDVQMLPLMGRIDSQRLFCFIHMAARDTIQFAMIIEIFEGSRT